METDIELLRHAAAMSGDGAALAAAQGQMSRLSGLQHRIESAQGGGLAAIRAEVMASVAATQATAQQARANVASAHTAKVALHAAQAEAHRVTGDFMHDFYERKIFDDDLRFGSSNDERAYREREEANRRAIETALAEGTPEGQLRALDLQRTQLLDAGDHGAANNPRYQTMLDENQAARDALATAVAAEHPEHQQQSIDALAPTEASLVSPELIAALRGTGATLSTPDLEGHGVSFSRARESGLSASV